MQIGRNALSTREHDRSNRSLVHLGLHDAILHIDRTQLDRFPAKAPQQSVRIAPPVVRGVRSRTQIVDIHRRKLVLELLRREQIVYSDGT